MQASHKVQIMELLVGMACLTNVLLSTSYVLMCLYLIKHLKVSNTAIFNTSVFFHIIPQSVR